MARQDLGRNMTPPDSERRKHIDEYRQYMRDYMRKRRANETPEQRARRLQRARELEYRRYHISLEKLGLTFVGSGRRREWNF